MARQPKTPARPKASAVTLDTSGVPRNAKGQQVCGRQKSRGRGPCDSPFIYPANGACKMHGGPSLAGAASPSFVHGHRSKRLPSGLRDHFEARRNDPNVLVLMDELALLEARMWELLEKLEDGGAATSRWSDLAAVWAKFEAAWAVKDYPGITAGRTAIEALITAGARDGKLWDDIKSVIELRRKVADTETKRSVREHRVLTEDRAYELLRLVLHVLRERISDRKLLGVIGGDLERVLGGAKALQGGPTT